MDNLFFTYQTLYPGKTDVILDAIKKGIEVADSMRMEGKDRINEINSHIMDALD